MDLKAVFARNAQDGKARRRGVGPVNPSTRSRRLIHFRPRVCDGSPKLFFHNGNCLPEKFCWIFSKKDLCG